MEARGSHTMEITIISAENLFMNGKPIKNDAYVVVHTQSRAKFFTTATQEEGGSSNNPSWNEKFVVDRAATCIITLEVQYKTWLGVRSVGAAQIAVADFNLGGFAAENNCEQFLSYRLWDGMGRRNGVVNFSVRVVKAPEYEPECSMQVVEIDEKNFRGFGMQVSMGGNDSSGIVTGIPVFWNYPLNIPR